MKIKSLVPVLLFTLSSTLAQAGFVGVYDYLSSLTQPFVAQTGAEPWTFRHGDQNAALMGVYSANTYGVTGEYAQFGSALGTGLGPGGTAGVNEAPGIFTHTANLTQTSAVFTADSAFLAESFVITSELVGNGNQGNGIDLTLRTVIGGVVTDHGTITILNTLSSQYAFDFGLAGLQFQAGDQVAAIFSSRGSYLYDHGWWDIALNEVNPNGAGVPESGTTVALLAGGLLGLMLLRQRRR